MIYTHTLNAGAQSDRLTPGARRQPLSPAEGSPLECDRLQEAAA